MSVIFNALPGIEVPVDAISTRLADMWTDGAAVTGEGHLEADDAKATQLNVVLHLGLNTTPEDAKVQFGHLLAFSRNSPCRVVVLCPLEDPAESTEMQAKIYGECHLGKSRHDKRCVEFVILSFMELKEIGKNLEFHLVYPLFQVMK